MPPIAKEKQGLPVALTSENIDYPNTHVFSHVLPRPQARPFRYKLCNELSTQTQQTGEKSSEKILRNRSEITQKSEEERLRKKERKIGNERLHEVRKTPGSSQKDESRRPEWIKDITQSSSVVPKRFCNWEFCRKESVPASRQKCQDRLQSS